MRSNPAPAGIVVGLVRLSVASLNLLPVWRGLRKARLEPGAMGYAV